MNDISKNSKAARNLRIAAVQLAAGITLQPIDARDTAFRRLDQRLQRAAVAYATKKART